MTKKVKTQKQKKNQDAAALGRLGGQSVARKRGKAYMSKIGKKGAQARWGKKKKKSK